VLGPFDDKVSRFLEGTCVFCQPWWLEAVAPGQWDVAVVYRGSDVAAVLPYTYKVRLGRFRLIEMPLFTPYLGPWLRNSIAKYANRLGEEKDLLTELIDKLPPFASFAQGFHPLVTNWLPFFWQGFKQTTHYTYSIDDTIDLNAAWDETRENIRTDIRKAEKTVTVTDEPNIERFLEIQRMTFCRQGKPLPYTEDALYRLEAACAERNSRRMLFAVDAENQVHAAIYLVWDDKVVYYLMGGGDPALRNSGATSLLMWRAIEFASAQKKRFDFEGSMVESIERFIRAFGARQVPYFYVYKMNSPVVGAYRLFWRRAHRRA